QTLDEHCSNFSEHIFDDHHSYAVSDFDNIESDIIVMTEKDAVKCEGFAKDNWYYLKVDIRIAPAIVDNIVNKLKLNKDLESNDR
ncbi:MAG: tetraacyldisaccharide 4'-kinase, partial [Kangiellaceae bacterium]|nr:tetraacyldisaccharide 4'-kinase [Kangiellaceae bacterium]